MWLIVLNRKSGRGRAKKLSQILISLLDRNKIVYELVDESSAIKTSEKIRELFLIGDFETLIAIGGDGLVHLCIQEIALKSINFGVIPAGTGNDFARCIGVYGKSVAEIFENYVSYQPKKLDLGRISCPDKTEWFVQVLSTGFDANVNAAANTFSWPRGKAKYTIATFLILSKFKSIKYEFDIDGVSFSQQGMLLTVANGSNYGGGMKISPKSLNSDGLLDLIMVGPVSRLTLLRIFPRVFSGRHIDHPKVNSYSGKRVQISADTSAFADGEFISPLPIEIEVVNGGLNSWSFK
jgi:diacylglycerol kinase (ATP)